MLIKKITPEQQRLVIEDLYNSTDSISSTKKFNEEYEENLGKVGIITMGLNDFVRLLLKTEFNHWKIEKVIKQITDEDVDWGKLE